MGQAEALAAWRLQLGDPAVLDAGEAQAKYGACTTGTARAIVGALIPARSDLVPELVRIADRFGIPIYPISTGKNWGYGTAIPARDGCVIVDLSQLTRIREFDPQSGIVTLEPGVTQGLLADFLEAADHPFMVPVTGAGPTCSIIGNALERGYGVTPWTDHFGAVTAIEAVLPDGRMYRPALSEMGASRVDRAFKWGIGPYLDGLFAQGSFGVVTAMTIALARRPDAVKAFLFGIDAEEGWDGTVNSVRELLGRLPGVVGGVNLMNARRVLAMAVPYPHEKLGVDGLIPDSVLSELGRHNGIKPWTGFGTVYGTAAVVRAAQREIRAALRGTVSRLVFVTPATARRLSRLSAWLPPQFHSRIRRRAAMLDSALEIVQGRPSQTALPLVYWRRGGPAGDGKTLDPARDGCGLIWYSPLVPMTGECVSRYVGLVTGTMRKHGLEPLITLTSLSDRCFDSSVPLLFDRQSSRAVEQAHACYRALLEGGQREGFIPYRIAIEAMNWLVTPSSTYWSVVGQIKRAVDPKGILSPGRYAP